MPPLVFTAIVASVAALRTLENATALVVRTLLWFALTALIAVIIGIALSLLIQPGLHTGVTAAAAKAPGTTGSWLDFLKSIVPANVFGLTASTTVEKGAATTALSFNVLQVIVAALAIGAASVRVGAPGESFLAFNASALVVFRRLLRWVIALTPMAIDPILDMGRTAINVAGQMLVPTIVSKRAGILDLDRHYGSKPAQTGDPALAQPGKRNWAIGVKPVRKAGGMMQGHWPEAANRRLRALLWKGCSLGEAAASMGRSLADVSGQVRRLGLRPLRFADDS